jgi:hypothetical protein
MMKLRLCRSGEDTEEVRQALQRGAAAAGARGGGGAAILRDGDGVAAGAGVRGHDGGRLPGGARWPSRRAPGPGGARRRRAEHLPQHRGGAAHHGGRPRLELHQRPPLAAAAQPAGLRLAPLLPDGVTHPHPMTIVNNRLNCLPRLLWLGPSGNAVLACL